MVSTQLKNISQIGSFPQVGVNIKYVWNHHLVIFSSKQPGTCLLHLLFSCRKVCTGTSISHGVHLEKSLHEILQGRSPLKFYHPKRKGLSSNHHFSGAVLVCGGLWGYIKNSGISIMWYLNGPLGVKTVKLSHFIIISGLSKLWVIWGYHWLG